MRKFEKLVQTLRDEIAQGTYKKGERLPTTPELCQIYEVSNTTVKRAMDELELQGLIARRRGSGVYVKEARVPSSSGRGGGDTSHQMAGSTAEYAAQGKKVRSRVIDFSVVRPPKDVAESLNVDEDEFVYHICRVRLLDEKPFVVEYTYMPIKTIPGLRESTAEGSIYAYIESELGLKIASAHRGIRAVMPTDDERDWLEVGDNDPLLEIRQTAYLDDGAPFECSVSRHISSYEFFSISTR